MPIFVLVRYIGNKTRLLDFIESVLKRRGIAPGSAVDPFSGTASVGAALKGWGFRVVASDVMEYAYVFAGAYIAAPGLPDLSGLAGIGRRRATLASVISHLNELPPHADFVHEHFSPDGVDGRRHGRMYFTPANAARIDAIRGTLERWRSERRINHDAFHTLLAALIEAADRVANTAGVYAAFVKSWQPNARRPLELREVRPVPGTGSRAIRGDALELVRDMDTFDVLYLDPPYNTRQYPGYYHVPELLALGWYNGEPTLRGKTGLLPDAEKRSAWSKRRQCEDAFEELVASAKCRRIVMSYNSEGIIPEATIARVLKTYGRPSTYRRYTRGYKRYRADADERRTYIASTVKECLYCVDR
jgi:adenine-specific DNA-methyltransferase